MLNKLGDYVAPSIPVNPIHWRSMPVKWYATNTGFLSIPAQDNIFPEYFEETWPEQYKQIGFCLFVNVWCMSNFLITTTDSAADLYYKGMMFRASVGAYQRGAMVAIPWEETADPARTNFYGSRNDFPLYAPPSDVRIDWQWPGTLPPGSNDWIIYHFNLVYVPMKFYRKRGKMLS